MSCATRARPCSSPPRPSPRPIADRRRSSSRSARSAARSPPRWCSGSTISSSCSVRLASFAERSPMLSILSAAVVVLAALAALQLLLVLGVIRRLREHTRVIARVHVSEPDEPMILPPGGSVGEFSATTLDGATLDRSGVPQPALFAFFSSGCGACRPAAAELARYASEMSGGRDHVIAVIGDGDKAAELADLVRGVARVIVEP